MISQVLQLPAPSSRQIGRATPHRCSHRVLCTYLTPKRYRLVTYVEQRKTYTTSTSHHNLESSSLRSSERTTRLLLPPRLYRLKMITSFYSHYNVCRTKRIAYSTPKTRSAPNFALRKSTTLCLSYVAWYQRIPLTDSSTMTR